MPVYDYILDDNSLNDDAVSESQQDIVKTLLKMQEDKVKILLMI